MCDCNCQPKSLTIKIKYFNKDITPLGYVGEGKGDWIDLRAAERVELKKGQFYKLPLGVGMILPEGYEAHVVPRSGAYGTWKIIQTNHMAVIDNSYSGDGDEWRLPILALEDTVIEFNDRICQFRVEKTQPDIIFETVDKLNDKNRGGFGSTGKN